MITLNRENTIHFFKEFGYAKLCFKNNILNYDQDATQKFPSPQQVALSKLKKTVRSTIS